MHVWYEYGGAPALPENVNIRLLRGRLFMLLCQCTEELSSDRTRSVWQNAGGPSSSPKADPRCSKVSTSTVNLFVCVSLWIHLRWNASANVDTSMKTTDRSNKAKSDLNGMKYERKTAFISSATLIQQILLKAVSNRRGPREKQRARSGFFTIYIPLLARRCMWRTQ